MANATNGHVHVEVVEGEGGSYKDVEAHPVKQKKVAWSLLISAILFIVCGIICLAWPGVALETVALVIGIVFLVGGIGSIADFAVSGGLPIFSGWMLTSGVVETLLGIVFLSRPLLSIWVISTVIAIAIIAAGVLQLVSAWRMRKQGGWFWIAEIVTGIVTIVLGILMLAKPATLAFWLAAFAIVYGVALGALAFRVPRVVNAIRSL